MNAHCIPFLTYAGFPSLQGGAYSIRNFKFIISFWQNNPNHLLKPSVHYPDFLKLFKSIRNSGKSLFHLNSIIPWKSIFILICRKISQQSGLSPKKQSDQTAGREGPHAQSHHARYRRNVEKTNMRKHKKKQSRDRTPWGCACPRYSYCSCAKWRTISRKLTCPLPSAWCLPCGVGLWPPPPSMLAFILAWARKSCACCYNHWEAIGSHPPPQAPTNFLLSLPQWFLSLGKRRCVTNVPVKAENSAVSFSLPWQLWVFVLTAIYYKRKLL